MRLTKKGERLMVMNASNILEYLHNRFGSGMVNLV
jgi:hypothetical protein